MASLPSRREALGSLSSVFIAGVAGCITDDQGFRDTGGTIRQSRQSVASGSENNLSFSATALDSFTDEHPGRISISLTNNRGQPLAMGVSHGIKGPFSVIRGKRTDGDGELIILADNPDRSLETPPGAPCRSGKYAIPESSEGGCWQPACEIPTVHHHFAISIQARATLNWEYVVLDGFNDSCLPPGTFAFEETAPIAYIRPGDTVDTTPSTGWSQLVTKQVILTLAPDGTLTADSRTEIETL